MLRVLIARRDTRNDKEAKRAGKVYHYEKTKNARYTWVQRDDTDGPRGIRRNFASNGTIYLQKAHKDGWGWFNIGCLIGFSTTSSSSACLPILNHVNSWRYVIGLRSRRVFFPMQLCWSLAQTIQHLLVEHICWTICLTEIELHSTFD